MKEQGIKTVVVLVYLVGNALTYNHAFKAGRGAIEASADMAPLIVKSLLVSAVWPAYWLYRAFTG